MQMNFIIPALVVVAVIGDVANAGDTQKVRGRVDDEHQTQRD
jgi:hypothetical protein